MTLSSTSSTEWRERVAAVVFTSSPQIDHLFEVARKHATESSLRQGLAKTKIAAVGPLLSRD